MSREDRLLDRTPSQDGQRARALRVQRKRVSLKFLIRLMVELHDHYLHAIRRSDDFPTLGLYQRRERAVVGGWGRPLIDIPVAEPLSHLAEARQVVERSNRVPVAWEVMGRVPYSLEGADRVGARPPAGTLRARWAWSPGHVSAQRFPLASGVTLT